jgi:hypothetical protein
MQTSDAMTDSVASHADAIDFWAARPLQNMKPEWSRMGTRLICPDSLDKWDGFALSEWELSAASWEDFHPHSETNFVVAGELHIECDGQIVVLGPGDAARVNAGRVGRYWAPVYARMVAVYGPNPDGLESNAFKYTEI